MNAWRLYSGRRPTDARVTLVHSNPAQTEFAGFDDMHRIPAPFGRSAPGQLVTAASGAAFLSAHHRDFDLVHGMTGYWLTVAPLALASRLGVPTVIKITGEGTETSIGRSDGRRLVRSIRAETMRRITAFVAISDTIATQLLEIGIDEARVWRIPNGVDTDLFQPPQTIEDRPNRKRILFVGSLVRGKRPHLAIEALHVMLRDIDAELWMVGPAHDAAYLGELEELAERLQVSQRIRWCGFTSEMPRVYQAGDVLCLPSSSEGMANAVLEAMATGIPFVATPASGMSDLAASGGGLIVEPSGETIATGLVRCIERKEVMGASGRQAAEAAYSTKVVLDEHFRRFRALVRSQVVPLVDLRTELTRYERMLARADLPGRLGERLAAAAREVRVSLGERNVVTSVAVDIVGPTLVA